MPASLRRDEKDLAKDLARVDNTRRTTESMVMFDGNDPADNVCIGLRLQYDSSKADFEHFCRSDKGGIRAALRSLLPSSTEKRKEKTHLKDRLQRIETGYKRTSQMRQSFEEISIFAFMKNLSISQNVYYDIASSEWEDRNVGLDVPDSPWHFFGYKESEFLDWWSLRQALALKDFECSVAPVWKDLKALNSSIIRLLEQLSSSELSGTKLDPILKIIGNKIEATGRNIITLLQKPKCVSLATQLFGYSAPIVYIALECTTRMRESFNESRGSGGNDLPARAKLWEHSVHCIDRLAEALLQKSRQNSPDALFSSTSDAEVDEALAALNALGMEELGLKDVRLSSQKGRQLGFGSFSVVYERYVPGGTSCYAVKEPTVKSGLDNDTILNRVRREAWIWKQLDHKNILPLRGFCQLPNEFPGLVMDVCKCSLKDFVCDCSPVTEKKKLDLLRGVSAGLTYLHSKKIAHGDLRADNILVKEFTANNGTDKDHIAVIADFGVAGFVDGASDPTCTQKRLAPTYDQVGHPNWLSPELLMKASSSERGKSGGESCVCISAPGDIYSFGCVFLEAMFERGPYQSFDSDEKKTKKLSGVLPATLEETSVTYFPFLCSTWDSEPANRPVAESVLHQMDEFLKPFAP
ncbi:kinase-like protein [Fomitiporia mediterranea MF3/22]|uniref:kinase-like protein n=1 Tax=Fomitiporia mediterranea (strain MF3/22) TaxID=694068 RepID=UPI0004409CD5|nr:kinase-like protein [Fomitiporia mediterranea MF3/22]EJC99799.1 kinase-like protein [Fomitiporia mediterranea MF3/22]